MSPLPLVLLIDLDGTVVGSVDHLATEFNLHTDALRSPSKQTKRSSRIKPCVRESIVQRLTSEGVLRPYFVEFARTCQNCELFVYTAGSDEWAAFIVPCIEAVLKTRKFNRPILSRSKCIANADGTYRKSTKLVKPFVYRALRAKYPALTSPDMLDNRIMLIDNTPDVLIERNQTIYCSTYSYFHAYDFLANITPKELRENFGRIVSMLPFVDPHTTTYESIPLFMAAFYSALAQDAKHMISEKNVKMLKDRFWKRFQAVLEKGVISRGYTFDKAVIKAINNKLYLQKQRRSAA